MQTAFLRSNVLPENDEDKIKDTETDEGDNLWLTYMKETRKTQTKGDT